MHKSGSVKRYIVNCSLSSYITNTFNIAGVAGVHFIVPLDVQYLFDCEDVPILEESVCVKQKILLRNCVESVNTTGKKRQLII